METATEDIREVGIGMLGYAFMGKAYSNGVKQMPYIFWPPSAVSWLIKIAGRDKDAMRKAARRYGFEDYTTDLHDVIEDERVEIFDNNNPNIIHMEPYIEAGKAKKDIICEKPLARNAEEADVWNESGLRRRAHGEMRLTMIEEQGVTAKMAKSYRAAHCGKKSGGFRSVGIAD